MPLGSGLHQCSPAGKAGPAACLSLPAVPTAGAEAAGDAPGARYWELPSWIHPPLGALPASHEPLQRAGQAGLT